MKNVIPVFSLSFGLWLALGAGSVTAQINSAQAVSLQKEGEACPLTVQDKLRYRVEEDPSKSTAASELLVTALGEVNFPVSANFDAFITLNVRGKTLAQVKAELKAKLDAAYYKNATVLLQIVAQPRQGGQVYFFGELQGNVCLRPQEPKTVTAGVLELGISEFANLKKIRIHRVDPTTQKTTKITVNVQKVLDGDHNQDVALQDGDRIEVPGKTFLF